MARAPPETSESTKAIPHLEHTQVAGGLHRSGVGHMGIRDVDEALDLEIGNKHPGHPERHPDDRGDLRHGSWCVTDAQDARARAPGRSRARPAWVEETNASSAVSWTGRVRPRVAR